MSALVNVGSNQPSKSLACPSLGNLESTSLLVRGVNWLGDAVMTTPALQRLHERFPRARITLLTSTALAPLWERQPGVDELITFDPTDNPWTVSRRLRSHNFDTALLFPNSTRSALEVWLAGIPNRIGYCGSWRAWFLTRSLKFPAGHVRPRRRSVKEVKRLVRDGNLVLPTTGGVPFAHQVHDYLYLAAALGADPAPVSPKLELSEEELQSASLVVRQLLKTNDSAMVGQPKIWLGINPSAAYGPAKRWPLERFAKVAHEICARLPNCVWLVFGTQADWQLCEELTRLGGAPILNLAGKTSLRQLMALLKKCQLLLTNDSGPMHLAAALGTPVVAAFGSTSPELTGPGLPGDPVHCLLRSNAACSPCFRRSCPIDFRCMNGIPAEQAIAAIVQLLNL